MARAAKAKPRTLSVWATKLNASGTDGLINRIGRYLADENIEPWHLDECGQSAIRVSGICRS